MSLDWTKPIRFKNGERCRLIETWSKGAPNFPDTTRIIERLDQDILTLGGHMSSIWWMKEDGISNWLESLGYNLINEDKELTTEETEFLQKANIDRSKP